MVAQWFRDNVTYIALAGGASLLAFLAGLVAVRFLVHAPPEFFLREGGPAARFRHQHPVLRWTLLVVKNVVGLLVAVGGVIMLAIPGPGVITLLLGLSLLDFPGKRALERRILTSPGVLRTLNALRARAGQPAITLPSSQPGPHS
jgi:hypothetical protein